MEREDFLSMIDLRLLAEEDTHLHWDPINQFYNKCHGKGGKFCSVGGGTGGGTSESSGGSSEKGSTSGGLHDSDGVSGRSEGPVKRGPRGGSLVDPNEGTKAIDGIKGYDPKGKPVPGSDAWLEAHGISKQVFKSRPYVKFEADKSDPALKEAFKEYPKADKFWAQRAEQEGQTGGYIMYKHQVPGSPEGAVAPQVRPNKEVVTNPAKRAYAEKVLANDKARLETLKTISPATLTKERRVEVKQAQLNLERIKTATPEKVREEAVKNVAKAETALKHSKEAGDPLTIFNAQRDLVNAKRQQIKDNRRANNWRPDKELYDAETRLQYSKNRLEKAKTDPNGALSDAIKSQERAVVRSENRAKKTAAKYVFSPGTTSARIDMNQDPQNVRNLTQGKGRIYFGMEGSIKADAILTSLKKEDPTATVVNVPSVTLWQSKNGGAEEIKWFAKTYGKGREIVLIPDADGITNPNVMAQAKAMSTALRSFAGPTSKVILAAPPLKAGTKRQIDHFNLPSGVDEGRKGIDDHLGAGRGRLGQLQYSRNTKVPSYKLTEFTKAEGAKEAKINRNAVKNTEAALAAISGIVGPEGQSRITKKMLAQAAGLPLTSAKEARDRLEKLGIISVEHIFDEQALSRGKRVRNPKVSDERVNELVRKGVIKEPRLDQPFTEVTIEESPVITIKDKRFLIKPEDVSTGTLSDLSTWKEPKNYKGWTSPINGAPDKTGIAAKQELQATKSIAKKAAVTEAARLAAKKAPAGRKLVRSKAGAKRYGVNIGDPIPVAAEGETVSLTLMEAEPTVTVDTAARDIEPSHGDIISLTLAEEFYNHGHDAKGRFAPGGGGSKSGGDKLPQTPTRTPGKVAKVVDKASKTISDNLKQGGDGFGGSKEEFPSYTGREITVLGKSRFGKVKVDGLPVKAAYEIKTHNGDVIRMYDINGKAKGKYEQMLNAQARMHELYPLKPPRDILVVSPASMQRMSGHPGTQALVYASHPYTFVSEAALNLDYSKQRHGWSMPSSKTGNTADMSYLMTHEYGHHVDFSKHYSNGVYKASPLFNNAAFKKAISDYGHRNPIEAYAEAFAEWHHSNGTTKNAAAVALARAEGWHGAKRVRSLAASALGDKLLSFIPMDLVHFGLLNFAADEGADVSIELPTPDGGDLGVSDDFDNGAELINGDQVEEPTADEIAKADELMQAVLKDLGLDEGGA